MVEIPVAQPIEAAEAFVRCGKGDAQRSVILDDRNGRIYLLDTWITAADIPNLIATLQAAADECDRA